MATSLTSSGVRFSDNSVQSAPALTMFRNRIINGDMQIDQRYNGTLASSINSSRYTLDRWRLGNDTGVAYTSVQRISDAPAGFSNSLKVTIVSSTTPLANKLNYLQQHLEGYNVLDFAWGTPNAAAITVSFWVKSSVTGNHPFSAGISNIWYVTSYNISSPNIWEYKTITIPGPTIGNWESGTNTSFSITFSQYVGSDFDTPELNSWAVGRYYSHPSLIDLVMTNGATFQITGVQLEKGSVATEFEFRPYQVELAMCQRYYQTYITVVEANVNFSTFAYAVPMRVAPTIAGGGAGFTINFGTAQAYNAYQSARASQTLTFSAEL